MGRDNTRHHYYMTWTDMESTFPAIALWWVRPLLVRLLVMLNAIQITQERFPLDNNNNNNDNDDTHQG